MITEYRTPADPMLDLGRRMGRFLSELSAADRPTWPFNSFSGTLPTTNIWENNEAYFIEMAAPGIESDAVSLSVAGKELTVAFQAPEISEVEREGHYLRRERATEFSSVGIALPPSIDPANITADLNNGILLIRIPKSAEAQVKKIEVKSAEPNRGNSCGRKDRSSK